jgi:hypothetical protein
VQGKVADAAVVHHAGLHHGHLKLLAHVGAEAEFCRRRPGPCQHSVHVHWVPHDCANHALPWSLGLPAPQYEAAGLAEVLDIICCDA